MVTGIVFDSDASHHALVVLLGLGPIEVVADGDLQRGLVSRFQLSLCWSENIGKIELHNGPLCIPKSSAAIARIRILVRSCSSFDF